MNTIIYLKENSSIKINRSYQASLQSLIKQNPELPITFNGDLLSFNPYVIGSLSLQDLTIIINPRINNLKINDYFEMHLFTEGLMSDDLKSLANNNFQFGLENAVINIFLKSLSNLVEIGVEGAFSLKRATSNVIRGRIIVEKLNPLNTALGMLPMEYSEHTLSTGFNKLIKLALDKISIIDNSLRIQKQCSLLAPYFEDIIVYPEELNSLLLDNFSLYHYENKHYPLVISLAKDILKNLKINFKNHDYYSSSYLINSNTVFENYVRKILSVSLKNKVEKWAKPKKFAELHINGSVYEKSYAPDILIGYNQVYNTALYVLDAKNKNIENPNSLANVADIYQLLFYCNSLKAESGALVYPSYKNPEFGKLSINGFDKNILYIFTLDFALPISQRHNVFIENIKNAFLLK